MSIPRSDAGEVSHPAIEQRQRWLHAENVGTWLDAMQDEIGGWDFWSTLTFKHGDVSLRFARRVAEQHLDRVGCDLAFYAVESGKVTGRNHVHALYSFGQQHPGSTPIWGDWYNRHGRAQVDEFDPELGATGYVVKYVAKEPEAWDLRGKQVATRSHWVSAGGRTPSDNCTTF